VTRNGNFFQKNCNLGFETAYTTSFAKAPEVKKRLCNVEKASVAKKAPEV